MAYCTTADIQEDFPSVVFNATAKVTLTSLVNHIVDADAIINSYLAGRYSVPVVGAEAVPVLKAYSRALVANKVRGILGIKQATNQGANQDIGSGLTTAQVMRALEGLRDGDSQLPGASLALVNGGIASFNVGAARERRFRTDEDQW
jgi:hypothetical protein